mgnify:CR=1 FL=1
MEITTLKYGVIGGSKGMGSWIVNYLQEKGCNVAFTSKDDDENKPTNHSLVKNSDVILLCVPITQMQVTLTEIFPHLQNKILLDVCSIKKLVIDKFNELVKEYPDVNPEFHSIHPMFSQRITSLEGQVILQNYSFKDQGFFTHFKKWLLADKAKIYELDYIRHDKIMGVVQGLTNFNIFVSARTLEQAGNSLGSIKDFSSPPYRIFLIFFSRYVLQNPSLYADIQMNNEFIPEVLAIFKKEVEKLYEIILKKDKPAFLKYVEDTKYYFEVNKEDTGISNHLIEQLGIYINRHK